MEVLHGIDLIEVERIKKSINSKKFKDRVYTKKEIKYCESKKKHKYESYAARFAAKEAFLKAIGVGMGKEIKLTDIEVIRDDAKPRLLLYNRANSYLKNKGNYGIGISLTHTKDLAIASITIIFYPNGGVNDKNSSHS